MTNKKSFSLVELVIALGVFTIIATAGAGFLTTTYKVTTTSDQNSKAREIVNEGIEVTKFIKRQNWTNLTNGNWGIQNSGSNWAFIANQDVVGGKYTRRITISDVYREEDSSIAVAGSPTAELDQFSKNVVVNVSWVNAANITKNLSESFLITNWEREVPGGGKGMLVYADYSGSDDIIKYKFLKDDNTWSSQFTIPDAGVPANRDTRRIELYSNPIRDEYILVTKHTEDGQFIYAHVWNGTNWVNPIELVGYGDNTNPNTRNYDGTYLSDGRFLVVYDDFTQTPKYRIWNGTSWSSQGSTGSLGLLGYPVWMEVDARPGSNRAIFVVKDYLQRTITFTWNGTGWTNQTSHVSTGSPSPEESISLEWNGRTNTRLALMFNEDETDSNPNIRLWNDSNSTWGSSVENISIGNTTRIFEITSSRTRDLFLGCAKTTNRTINCLTSNFTPTWANNLQIANRTHSNSERSFSTAFENNGNRALVVYSNGSNDAALRIPKYRTFNAANNTWSSESSLSALGPDASYALNTVRVIPSDDSNQILVLMGDGTKRVHSVVWNGDSGSFYTTPSGFAQTMHGIYGSYTNDFWYAFAWKEYEN